jgi:hypothetical protein
MKPLFETELLLSQFSDKIKFKVVDLYFDICKMVIFVKVNNKKNNESLIKSEIEMLSIKLKIFTGIETYIIIGVNNYISFIGHSIFIGCNSKINYILTPSKRRKY